MNIALKNGFYVSDINAGDKPAFIEHFKEKHIYDNTCALPYPYTDKDADWWINHLAEEEAKLGQSVSWCVRREDGYLIGGIGFVGITSAETYKAEIGYWMAKEYRGQGVITDAIEKLVQYGFKELALVRITAMVFPSNQASCRVLEKAGFKFECTLRNFFKKNGKIFDGLLYAIIKN
jgi:[ribosomal protein S5]-alanine N-acetyltransferase